MNYRRRAKSRRETAELNITAFMNLMVVLVPFLLITAVFSRITILELNLPTADMPSAQEEKSLDLTVVVRRQGLHVFATGKPVKSFSKNAEKYPLAELNALLQKIKQREPEILDARVLLEPDIKYETLVHVMDAMRVVVVAGEFRELFPAISIGDAAPGGLQP